MSAVGWTDITATPSQADKQILFTSGSTITIDAPANVVFDTITSFSRYGDWNTWTTSFTFPQSDSDVKIGSVGTIDTHRKGRSSGLAVPVEVCELRLLRVTSNFGKSSADLF